MAWAEALAGGGTLTGASGFVQVGQVAVSGSVAGASVAVGTVGVWLQIGVHPLRSSASVSMTSPRCTRGRGRRIVRILQDISGTGTPAAPHIAVRSATL